MDVLAQGISIVAMIVSIFALQFKSNKAMFIGRGASGLLFAVSYVMMGSYTAAALNFINLLRSVFVVNKKTQGKIFMVLIIAVYTVATVLTFGGYLSVLILLAQAVESIVMWGRNGKHIRICQLSFVSPIWLFHNVVKLSIGGLLAEIFVIASAIIAIVRFRKTGFKD